MQRNAVHIGMTSLTRRRLIWLLVVLPVATVLLLGVYNASALPGCDSCHDGGLIDATAASSHAGTECASCHVAPGAIDRLSFGFRQLFHMQLKLVGEGGRDWADVPDPRCITCHLDIETGVTNSNGISVRHSECARSSSCTDCHSTVAHGKSVSWVRVYDMETCLECHVTAAQTDCDMCHKGQRTADRVDSGVFAVTHGEDWQKTHGMGNSANCTVCHTAANCNKCHGPGLPHDSKFVSTHTTYAQDPKAQCTGCHATSFCSDCHGLEMPHSPTFTAGHEKPATENEALCKRCHAESDCVTCHVKHVHPGGAIGTLGTDGASGGGQ